MKVFIVYKITPLSYKQILRCDKGTCNHVPIFATSWEWLAKFVTWLKGDMYHESLDENCAVESVIDDGYETYLPEGQRGLNRKTVLIRCN